MVWVVVLGGCAAPTESLSVTPSMADGLCWWQGVRWDDRAPLRVPSVGEPFGRARVGWSKTDWKGATVTGVLRARASTMVLQGVWAGDGMTLRAEADATADAIFTMWEAQKLSRASLVLRGSPVRVLDARVGAALVAPSVQALSSFVPDELPAREVKCDALALRATPASQPDARQLLARGGFAADAPEVRVSAEDGSALVATDAAEGSFVGGFLPSPSGRFFEVGRAGERVRVVAVDDATLWVGWVAASGVTRTTSEVASAAPRSSAARRELTLPTWRACPQPLELRVRGANGLRMVGTLHAGTRFALTGRTNGFDDDVGIWPGVDWFEPTRDVFAPAAAGACPEVVGPW